jgi:plasminogen activator inhibitor 1 RNA-binding protein
VKKGGGGKANWGKNTDTWDDVPQEEAEKTATPATGDAPEAAETKVEAVQEPPRELTEEEKKQKEQEEKEAKWLSLEEYRKQKEDAVKALPQLPPPRQAGEGVDKKEAQKWASYQALSRDEEEAARTAAEKESQEKKSKKNFVPVNEVLDVRKPRTPKGDRPERGDRPPRGDRPERGDRPPRGDRPARGGQRGAPRGGQKGGRGGSAPTFVNDASAFPTLSTATKA